MFDEAEVIETMLLDITKNSGRKIPHYMKGVQEGPAGKKQPKANKRQFRHLD
jgi:hypothetical protein